MASQGSSFCLNICSVSCFVYCLHAARYTKRCGYRRQDADGYLNITVGAIPRVSTSGRVAAIILKVFLVNNLVSLDSVEVRARESFVPRSSFFTFFDCKGTTFF